MAHEKGRKKRRFFKLRTESKTENPNKQTNKQSPAEYQEKNDEDMDGSCLTHHPIHVWTSISPVEGQQHRILDLEHHRHPQRDHTQPEVDN